MIVITGSSGFLGKSLTSVLPKESYRTLNRKQSNVSVCTRSFLIS